METFFILLTLVFVPFLWLIRRALRFTEESVGADSPVYKERTYQFTASQYFGSFLKIMIVFMIIMMLVAAYIFGKAALIQEPLLFIFTLVLLVFAGLFGFVIYFDWQYWTITRNVQVTFNPFQPSLTIDSPFQYSVLTPDNVVRIEQHVKETSNSKDILGGYGYYLFYNDDGTVTPINNIFFNHVGHFEFLERFFPSATRRVIQHRLPWVTDINQAGNPEPPNFDTQN